MRKKKTLEDRVNSPIKKPIPKRKAGDIYFHGGKFYFHGGKYYVGAPDSRYSGRLEGGTAQVLLYMLANLDRPFSKQELVKLTHVPSVYGTLHYLKSQLDYGSDVYRLEMKRGYATLRKQG